MDWREVARELDGRTNRECRKRYCYSLSKGIKKGTWSRSEDEAVSFISRSSQGVNLRSSAECPHSFHRHSQLLKGYQLWGAWWSKVAQEHVVNRTGDQCAKRFKDVLDPTINKVRKDKRKRFSCALTPAAPSVPGTARVVTRRGSAFASISRGARSCLAKDQRRLR